MKIAHLTFHPKKYTCQKCLIFTGINKYYIYKNYENIPKSRNQYRVLQIDNVI